MTCTLIYGGGTFSNVSCHLSLAAPAFGNTAKYLKTKFDTHFPDWDNKLILTKMADSQQNILTNHDLHTDVISRIEHADVKVVIMTSAVCDFYLQVNSDESRLSSSEVYPGLLIPQQVKIISEIKKYRPDICVVGFKTTSNQSISVQENLAYKQINNSNVDIVFANDVSTRQNIIIVRKGGQYIDQRNILLDMLPKLVHNCIKSGNTYEPFKCYQ